MGRDDQTKISYRTPHICGRDEVSSAARIRVHGGPSPCGPFGWNLRRTKPPRTSGMMSS